MTSVNFRIIAINECFAEVECYGRLLQTNALQDILSFAQRLASCGTYLIILDLNRLKNLDSVGVSALLSLVHNRFEYQFLFVCKNLRVLNFLKSLELANQFDIFASRDDALASSTVKKSLLNHTEIVLRRVQIDKSLSQYSANNSASMLDVFGKPLIVRLLDELENLGARTIHIPVEAEGDPLIRYFRERPRKTQIISFYETQGDSNNSPTSFSAMRSAIHLAENGLSFEYLSQVLLNNAMRKSSHEHTDVCHPSDLGHLNAQHKVRMFEGACDSVSMSNTENGVSPQRREYSTSSDCEIVLPYKTKVCTSNRDHHGEISTVHNYFQRLKVLAEVGKYNHEFSQIEEKLFVGVNVQIGKNFESFGSTYICSNSVVTGNCSIIGTSILSEACRLETGTVLQHSLLTPGTSVKEGDFLTSLIASNFARSFHTNGAGASTSLDNSHKITDLRQTEIFRKKAV